MALQLALMEAQQMRGDAERLARMHDEIHKEMADSFTQLWQEAVRREQARYLAQTTLNRWTVALGLDNEADTQCYRCHQNWPLTHCKSWSGCTAMLL